MLTVKNEFNVVEFSRVESFRASRFFTICDEGLLQRNFSREVIYGDLFRQNY